MWELPPDAQPSPSLSGCYIRKPGSRPHQSPPSRPPVSMCDTITDKLTQQLTEQVTISRKRKPGESSTSPVVKKAKVITPTKQKPPAKMYSNSLSNCIKMFCGECDHVVNLSGLQRHLRRAHDKNIVEYRKTHGDPHTQIIQMVYHTCVLCRQDVFLDYDFLQHHLRLEHSTTLAKYNSQHMSVEAGALVLHYDSQDSAEDDALLLGELQTKVEQPLRELLKGSLKLEGTRITAVKRGASPTPISTITPPCLSSETKSITVKTTATRVTSSSESLMSTIETELTNHGYA